MEWLAKLSENYRAQLRQGPFFKSLSRAERPNDLQWIHQLIHQSREFTQALCLRYSLCHDPRYQPVFAEHALEYDVKLEVGGYDVIKKYVELGLGISIVMSHCLTGADHLHSVPLGRWFPKRTYGVVLRNGVPLSPAAARFVEMIRAEAKTRHNGRTKESTTKVTDL